MATPAVKSLPRGLTAGPDPAYGGLDHWMSACSLYVVVEGMCACSLFTPKPTTPGKSRLKRMRKKYEQQGWSEAKIERALADISEVPKREVGLSPKIANWTT